MLLESLVMNRGTAWTVTAGTTLARSTGSIELAYCTAQYPKNGEDKMPKKPNLSRVPTIELLRKLERR
jgi:hypothetical protein